MGFFEDLIKDLELWGAVQASKDKNGKPDPYKAAGIAAGMGNFSWSDQAMLAGMLGSQGAFDDDIPNHDYDINFDYLDPKYDKTPAEDVKDWQITAELNDYGISPFDYDTEEEYLEAVAEAEADAEDVVHDALDRLADGQGLRQQMEHPLRVLPDMEDLDAAQGAPVGGLSAALRVEGGAVQFDLEALLRFRTIHNNGGKLCQTAVGIV